MQKQALGSINKILHRKRFNVLTTIYHQHQTALDAKQYLMAFDIPYFQHVSVAFFDGKKLLLSTEIPELLAKFRELNDDLIALLNTHDYFADVKILTLKLQFPVALKDKRTKARLSKKTCHAFQDLANELKNDQIKQSIIALINKHHER